MTDLLATPRRQPPVAMVAQLLSVQMLRQFGEMLIPLAVIGIASRGPLLYVAIPGAVVVVVANVVLRWWRTTFWADDDEFVLEKGVLTRTRVQIPFDRIQQISTEQGIVQQLLGVRRVEIDTAGSSGAELSFAALTDDVVDALRSRLVGIEARPDGPMAPGVVGVEGPGRIAVGENVPLGPPPLHEGSFGAGAATELRRPATPVVRFTVGDLVRVGVANPGLQALGGILALSGLGLGRALDRFVEDNVTSAVGLTLLVVALLGGFFAVLIGGSVLRNFDLTVWRGEQGLRLTAGLFTKRELFARPERVQMVRRRSNLLERWLGRTSLAFPQASAVVGADGTAGGRSRLFAVPSIPDGQVPELTALFVPGVRADAMRPIDPLAIRRWTIWAVGLPTLTLLAVAALALVGPVARPVPVLLVIAALLLAGCGIPLARLIWNSWCWALDDAVLSVRHGLVVRNQVDVAARKIQTVELVQSWWQRRHGLATVRCRTAGGSFSIPHLPEGTARALRDDVLLIVETDRGPWM